MPADQVAGLDRIRAEAHDAPMRKPLVLALLLSLSLAGSATAQLDPFRRGHVGGDGTYQPPWATSTPNRPASDEWWRPRAAVRRNSPAETPPNNAVVAPTMPTGPSIKGPTLPYLEPRQQPDVQWR